MRLQTVEHEIQSENQTLRLDSPALVLSSGKMIALMDLVYAYHSSKDAKKNETWKKSGFLRRRKVSTEKYDGFRVIGSLMDACPDLAELSSWCSELGGELEQFEPRTE